MITNFAWVSLNPAGQRMLGQPKCPTSSLLTLFPTAKADGVFAMCCRAFETGELGRNQTNYQADGLDGYFLFVAQRYADLLVVNFTNTNDQPRTPVEEALRASQQREQAARAEAEAQRANLTRVFQQAPAAICVLAGPELMFDAGQPAAPAPVSRTRAAGTTPARGYARFMGPRGGRILRQVYATGGTHESPEIMVPMSRVENGTVEDIYFRNVSQPRFNAEG